MSTSLPTRPNLDHLREQAKDLLALDALQGEWAIVSLKLDGMLLPNHHFPAI